VSAAAGQEAAVACSRPQCDGFIDEDGYCDVCGHVDRTTATARPAAARPRADGVAMAPTGHTRSTRTLPTTSTSSRGGRSTGPTGTRGTLGAGLVVVPPVPQPDPASVVITTPVVPPHRRRCSVCQNSLGTAIDGGPAPEEGFCTVCGARYSFSPKLTTGDLVDGKYLVAGCLAHGGMGWVYLAEDLTLQRRWVVLKGLLDTGDRAAMAAALAERQFLAEVSHTNIVEIHSFVEHGGAGYIVMEYVSGSSLRDIRAARRAEDGRPLPLAIVLAYGLEVLQALGFLHSRGLLYCDLKPDNVIQGGELVKLIDLGGARRVDDPREEVYGTVGYQAPEIRESGPSFSSDLYTVARLMLVLAADVPGFGDPARYATELPPADVVPLFADFPAFHDLMLRATDPDPTLRFTSAAEMEDQLLGVLRQVVSDDQDVPPARSLHFGGERIPDPAVPTWTSLPVPLVDPADAASGLLANLAVATPEQVLAALAGVPPTLESRLRQVRAHLELADVAAARQLLDEDPAVPPPGDRDRGPVAPPPPVAVDWRVRWWLGVAALVAGECAGAVEQFAAVARWLPGELAPRLALAVAHEQASTRPTGPAPAGTVGTGAVGPTSVSAAHLKELRAAEGHYALVAATDASLSSASFGAARVRMRLGERAGAVAALDHVPAHSIAWTTAQVRLCTALSASVAGSPPGAADLLRAGEVLTAIEARDGRSPATLSLRREVLTATLDHVRAGGEPVGMVAGVPATEAGLGGALESTLRALAAAAPSTAERILLVDQANSYRPWSTR